MISTGAKIKDKFWRIACDYESHADIQFAVSDELLKRIEEAVMIPQSILDIGCGTGRLITDLRGYFPNSKILGLDISFAMSRVAESKGIDILVADAIALPFQKGLFDLVVSNLAYQWVRELDEAFREVKRVLKQNSVFLFNCFGTNTLQEVRSCFGIEDNPLPTKDIIYRNLKYAGFSNINLEVSLKNKYFDNLTSILIWLKNIGANRIYARQPFFTPMGLMKANNFYQKNYKNNGKVYASFEIIWGRAIR